MAIPLIPWEPHVFPIEIQQELNRRAINRGLKFVNTATAKWEEQNDDWSTYRGPMTSWVRACSNGQGIQHKNSSEDKPGFVFYGGKDFYTGYGFNNGGKGYEANDSIIGYTPLGIPHVIHNAGISNYPIHVPPPEIEKISANIQKEYLRRVSLEWVCFSSAQLEYMTPYFLVPGISVIVEWGWNHFNPLSLLDLTSDAKLKKIFNNPYPLYTDNVLKSRGNYEVLFGIVTNFEWSIDGNKIRCRTEITSKDRIWAGQMITANMIQEDAAETTNTRQADSSTKPNLPVIDSLRKFVDSYIDKFSGFVGRPGQTEGQVFVQVAQSAISGQPQTTTIERKVTVPATATMEEPGVRIPSFANLPTTKIIKEEVPISFSELRNNPLKAFIDFMVTTHPDNYQEYLFGVFEGRKFGPNVPPPPTYSRAAIQGVTAIDSTTSNSVLDFDSRSQHKYLWLNMGLIVEIINYHANLLRGMDDQPMFRVDIEDCVISGHPNLISTDGDVLLIPNAMSPKYFSGVFGRPAENGDEYDKLMNPSSVPLGKHVNKKDLDPDNLSPDIQWADYRIQKIIYPLSGVAHRDDISSLINSNRIVYKPKKSTTRFEFPLAVDVKDNTDKTERTYKALFTGYLKNLYISAEAFKKIIHGDGVKSFPDVYNALFDVINTAAANFWDLRLVGSSGRESTEKLATMKIIDTHFTQYTSNDGQIYTFDYYGADSLFHSINFRPTLSNAQAIRTIYAATNQPVGKPKPVVLSDKNELLDYHFYDRLFLSESKPTPTKEQSQLVSDSYQRSMKTLQGIRPPDGAFQMTQDGIIYRIAIPKANADILSLLLDDEDKGHNPRYTGIMPGIQAEFTLQGIAGIRTFGLFRVRGLPEPYSEKNIVFRIINVTDTIQNGNWMTTIIAGVIPLTGYFRSVLHPSDKLQVPGQTPPRSNPSNPPTPPDQSFV